MLDDLEEPDAILIRAALDRRQAPRFRDAPAEILEDPFGVPAIHLESTPVPADQAHRLGTPRPAEVELAHQQARPAHRGAMDPDLLPRRDEDRRSIAGDVADLDLLVAKPPGEATAVPGQGEQAVGRRMFRIRERPQHGRARSR